MSPSRLQCAAVGASYSCSILQPRGAPSALAHPRQPPEWCALPRPLRWLSTLRQGLHMGYGLAHTVTGLP
eukprot:7792918-Alexandrium_andersonii.AAC.1